MAIICGVDFSEAARSAVRTAAGLATRRHESLWLVHALEPAVETTSAPSPERVTTELVERLEQTARQLEGSGSLAVRVAVPAGRADEVLRSFARDHEGTLIVVGSRGHRAESLIRPGGVSERLAMGLELPLLVVRDDQPFEAWSHGQAFRALVGLDDSNESASAVRHIESLRQVGPIDVVIGRVYYAEEAHRRYGVHGRFSMTDPDPDVERFVERDLKRRVPHLRGDGELFYRVRLGVGRIADHLLEIAEAERCDLVVIGSHGRKGVARLWSVSATALHLARMAVLVVPDDGRGLGVGVSERSPVLRRVLVATDLSPFANVAIPWAYAVVDPQGEVILAHVTLLDRDAGELLERYLPGLTPQARSRVEAEVAARLRSLIPTAPESRGVVTRTEVCRGTSAATELLAAAERVGADAVVIASHGRSGLTRTLLGSVAEQVLRASKRPVFVVRVPAEAVPQASPMV
jgi:nucleotide-binding universal stress UspA family protein